MCYLVRFFARRDFLAREHGEEKRERGGEDLSRRSGQPGCCRLPLHGFKGRRPFVFCPEPPPAPRRCRSSPWPFPAAASPLGHAAQGLHLDGPRASAAGYSALRSVRASYPTARPRSTPPSALRLGPCHNTVYVNCLRQSGSLRDLLVKRYYANFAVRYAALVSNATNPGRPPPPHPGGQFHTSRILISCAVVYRSMGKVLKTSSWDQSGALSLSDRAATSTSSGSTSATRAVASSSLSA